MQDVAVREVRFGVEKLSLECTACGYGVARQAPPERCPMCQRETTWAKTRRRRVAR